jgi:hypothetical protein
MQALPRRTVRVDLLSAFSKPKPKSIAIIVIVSPSSSIVVLVFFVFFVSKAPAMPI